MRNDFIFDGLYAYEDFGLLICDLDKTATVNSSNIISSTNFMTVQPAGQDKLLFIGSNYQNTLTKTIQVIKCVNDNAVALTVDDIEAIQRWLCREDGYYEFTFVGDNIENIYYEAKIDANLIEIDQVPYGFELNITTNSPYGYSHVKAFNDTLTDLNSNVTIIDNSSKMGNTYLNITLTCMESGDYELQNTIDNRITKINNCSAGEIITITDNQIITSSNEDHNICDDFNYAFPRIINNKNQRKNEFVINKECNLKVTYKQKRKVGL